MPLRGGGTRPFPTLDDYVTWLVTNGKVIDKRDLVENHHDLVSEIFFQWLRTKQVGCLFAAKLAKSAASTSEHEKERVKWDTIVVADALALPDLGGHLNSRLDIAAQTSEVIQIILPSITTYGQVVQLVNAVCKNPRWYWNDVEWTLDDEWERSEPSCRLVGLRWILPCDKHVNQVLGFMAIDSAPITRRSPFSAIILRVSAKKREPEIKWKIEDDRLVVHLADMDSHTGSQEAHDRMSIKTSKWKKGLLEDATLPSTKAKVTFQIPLKEAAALCPPHDPKEELVKIDAPN